MIYCITVFNQIHLAHPFNRELLRSLQTANFVSLSLEYGIDPALIEPAKSNLDIMVDIEGRMNYFLVRYQPVGQAPIVIYRKPFEYFNLNDDPENAIFTESLAGLKERLLKTKVLFVIELKKKQLTDMGLLIAYECARWLAFHGKGLVRDLHGNWYALNDYQAFLPFK